MKDDPAPSSRACRQDWEHACQQNKQSKGAAGKKAVCCADTPASGASQQPLCATRNGWLYKTAHPNRDAYLNRTFTGTRRTHPIGLHTQTKDSRRQPHLELLKPIQVLLLLLAAAAAPGAVGVGARGAGDAVQGLKGAAGRRGAGPTSTLLDGVQQAPVGSVCCQRAGRAATAAAATAPEKARRALEFVSGRDVSCTGKCAGDAVCSQAEFATAAVSRPRLVPVVTG